MTAAQWLLVIIGAPILALAAIAAMIVADEWATRRWEDKRR